MTGRHVDDRAEDRRELRRLPRRVKDVVGDAVDLVGDVAGIAWTVFDTVEDTVESAVAGRLGRERHGGHHRRRPKRPGKSVGHSRGDIDGTPLSKDDLEHDRPSSSWAGERKDLCVPFLFMRANGGQLRDITRLIEAGAIRPVVDKVFAFESTNEALAYSEAGHAKGKVVIKIR